MIFMFSTFRFFGIRIVYWNFVPSRIGFGCIKFDAVMDDGSSLIVFLLFYDVSVAPFFYEIKTQNSCSLNVNEFL